MTGAPNTVVAAITKTVAQRFVPVVKLPTTMPAATVLVHHGEKSKKINGLNFKRW